jgi:hypothetical protein
MPMRFAIISVTRASVPRSTLPHSRHLGQLSFVDAPLMRGLPVKAVLRLTGFAKE